MALFRSQMWKVLEWKDDSRDTMVFRFPMNGQEIMKGSQLTVRESQVAIFVSEGQIADVFAPGRYKLDTKNIPILSGIGSIWYQKQSRFKAELYFVNTKQFLGVKWGTTSPVTMRDKEFGMIRIKAYGTFGFKVEDPVVFLKEVFGTNGKFTVSGITDQLKSNLVSIMSDTISESKISALDMASNYTEFGQMVQNNAREKFSAIGLSITDFVVANINFPEAVEKAIDERSALGIFEDKMGTYTQKKAADALGDAAKNPNGMAGAFVGMNVGQGVGSVFGNMANAKDKEPAKKEVKGRFCAECGAELSPTAKFCAECGTKQEICACPKCNVEVKPSAKFCPECGEKLK